MIQSNHRNEISQFLELKAKEKKNRILHILSKTKYPDTSVKMIFYTGHLILFVTVFGRAMSEIIGKLTVV